MIEDTERRLEYDPSLQSILFRLIENECLRHQIEVKRVDCMEELQDTIGRMANGRVYIWHFDNSFVYRVREC